jgi:hypothetical protein
MRRRKKQATRDPVGVRDLLDGGCFNLGRLGSGKTSSSGESLMDAIIREGGGLILAAKPEDAEDVRFQDLRGGTPG